MPSLVSARNENQYDKLQEEVPMQKPLMPQESSETPTAPPKGFKYLNERLLSFKREQNSKWAESIV